MPFVDLALSELETLRNASDELASPVGVLEELVLKDLQLVLVLALATLNVAAGHILILGFLEKGGHTLVQIAVFKFEIRNVERVSGRGAFLRSSCR